MFLIHFLKRQFTIGRDMCVTLILITLHTTSGKTEEREQAVYLGENKECNYNKIITTKISRSWAQCMLDNEQN
jgi:hypothetical protein